MHNIELAILGHKRFIARRIADEAARVRASASLSPSLSSTITRPSSRVSGKTENESTARTQRSVQWVRGGNWLENSIGMGEKCVYTRGREIFARGSRWYAISMRLALIVEKFHGAIIGLNSFRSCAPRFKCAGIFYPTCAGSKNQGESWWELIEISILIQCQSNFIYVIFPDVPRLYPDSCKAIFRDVYIIFILTRLFSFPRY